MQALAEGGKNAHDPGKQEGGGGTAVLRDSPVGWGWSPFSPQECWATQKQL